jgi:hypothetical protein
MARFARWALRGLAVWWAILACLGLGGPVYATAEGPDFYRPRGIAPGNPIPLRVAPRDDAPAVGRLDANATCLRSLGCQGGLSLEEFSTLSESARQQRLRENPRWCQVLVQGRSGWVPGHYLAESSTDCTGPRYGLALSGNGSVVRRGEIRGDTFVDYLVLGRAGQSLAVTLTGAHPQTYFNLTPPGSPWAMFVGSTSGNQALRMLPVDGLYAVRVYLMRAAARRQVASRYTLTLRLSGDALQARDPSQDARIAGTPYHAQATVACRQAADPSRSHCDASVIRYQRQGSAMVELRWNEGNVPRVRRLLFVDGRVVDSDAVDPPRAQGPGDPVRIDVGTDEHYEFAQALVSGG